MASLEAMTPRLGTTALHIRAPSYSNTKNIGNVTKQHILALMHGSNLQCLFQTSYVGQITHSKCEKTENVNLDVSLSFRHKSDYSNTYDTGNLNKNEYFTYFKFSF